MERQRLDPDRRRHHDRLQEDDPATSPATTDRVRLRITGSRAAPAIAEIGLYKRPGSSSTGAAITSGLAGKCMDVNGGGTASGTPVQLWDCNGGANQQWKLP